MTKTHEQVNLFSNDTSIKKIPAKRVNIVSLKMVRESSILYPDRAVRSPHDAVKLVRPFLQEADREHFLVVCLDTKNQPTSITTCHIGSLNSSIVHPRECFKTAILSNAASILVAHNHPSGTGHAAPSSEDIDVTRRLKDAGDLLGIELIDHVIVAGQDYYSLKENGQL